MAWSKKPIIIDTAPKTKPSKVTWFCFCPVCGSVVATFLFTFLTWGVTTFFTEICLITGLSTLTAVVAVLAFLTVFVFLSVSIALPKWRFAWGWKNTSSLLLVAGAWLTVPASGKWVLTWGSPNWGVSGSSESLELVGRS